MTASVIVRKLAALSGASAVAAGAYGAHGRNSTLAYTLECMLEYFRLAG